MQKFDEQKLMEEILKLNPKWKNNAPTTKAKKVTPAKIQTVPNPRSNKPNTTLNNSSASKMVKNEGLGKLASTTQKKNEALTNQTPMRGVYNSQIIGPRKIFENCISESSIKKESINKENILNDSNAEFKQYEQLCKSTVPALESPSSHNDFSKDILNLLLKQKKLNDEMAEINQELAKKFAQLKGKDQVKYNNLGNSLDINVQDKKKTGDLRKDVMKKNLAKCFD